MKRELITNTKGIIAQIMILSFLVFFTAACKKKITFPVSSVIPTADASVKIDKDKNGNYEIDLTTKNMADPQRLQPPKKTYVVWIETPNGVKNIGQLNISNLKGSLETTSSFKPNRIFITAEDDGTLEYPGNMVVLETEVPEI